MKLRYGTIIFILLVCCKNQTTQIDQKENTHTTRKAVVPVFQAILDTALVKGSILIYNLKEDRYYSNDFDWAQQEYLPASTFKIANSIIALETGVVENDSTCLKWNGEKRRLKNWEQDLTLKDAFHLSCVPCYQEIARKIGAKRMNEYLDTLKFGNMKVDEETIDLFWLQGESSISQFQQIDFLKRLYQAELPISEQTATIMKRLMVIEEADNYRLSGKTGWSISNDNHNAWFVGYIESQKNVFFFATNIAPKGQFDAQNFPRTRKSVTFKAFEKMLR